MDQETCKKELVIEIPVDVVQREAESVTAQYARVARIPGFRPGHAPSTLVRRHFRDDIRSEVVQSLLPKFFENAVKEQKWSLAGRPAFEELKFEDGQPLTCRATFEVYPDFPLGEYKGLEAEEEAPTVTDGDVDNALEEVRQRAATFELVADRAAQADDYLVVNYRGHEAQKPESHPLEARDAMIHLGAKGTVAEFRENLAGAKPGETRQFDVTYPAEYNQKSLAGKTFNYRVEVLSIKQRVVPDMDDELAKSVSDFGTLQEVRGKVRQDLEARRKLEVQAAARSTLLERLIDLHPFPVPKISIEEQLNRRLEGTVRQLMAQGIDPRKMELDWTKLREDARPKAEREVRGALILEKIAEKEMIEVPEAEVDDLIRQMAQERRETPAALKTRLTQDGELDRINSTRRNQKALDFVYQNAKITRKNEAGTAPSEA